MARLKKWFRGLTRLATTATPLLRANARLIRALASCVIAAQILIMALHGDGVKPQG